MTLIRVAPTTLTDMREYMLNMVIILIVMYCNVVTAIDKIPTYLLRFNMMKKLRYQTVSAGFTM